MKTTISQLRVFDAVARTKSMSKAAEELKISQPSVSTQLRAIENHAHARLLARDGHTISLTRLGRIVLPKVRALLAIAADIDGVLSSERSLESGLLRLGYSTHQFAMPLISGFMKAHPGVKVEARSMASLDVIARLRGGLVDVAMVTADIPPADLYSIEVRRDDVVLMVPVGHPLTKIGDDLLSWSQVSPYPLIRREETSGTRVIFDAAARQAGVTLKTILDLGSWESMRAGVIPGIAIGVALMGETEPNESYRVMRIDDPALVAGHHVACLPEMSHVAAVEAFLAIASTDRDASVTEVNL